MLHGLLKNGSILDGAVFGTPKPSNQTPSLRIRVFNTNRNKDIGTSPYTSKHDLHGVHFLEDCQHKRHPLTKKNGRVGKEVLWSKVHKSYSAAQPKDSTLSTARSFQKSVESTTSYSRAKLNL